MSNHSPRRIAVIGGGPSGAQCARRLAEHGLNVTLFESRSGYEKPCGGGLPARGMERFPFLDTPRLPMTRIDRCVAIAPSGREADFPLQDPLFIFSRADLQTLMLDRANEAGVLLIRRRVIAFQRDGVPGHRQARSASGGWWINVDGEGTERGPFDFLVAADGASGSARRRLIGSIDRLRLTQGIGYYIPGLSEDRIILKFLRGLQGYLWVFPRTDHSSAGICAPLGMHGAASLQLLMDRFLAERYGREVIGRSTRYAALIPGSRPGSGENILAGDGWAVVGDGGCAVDALTREGIYYAMLTGEILADCLVEGRPELYPEAFRRRFGDEFARAARMAPTFFADRFTEALVLLCSRSTTIASTVSDLITGRQPYRGLKRRLLLASPVVAWQLLRGAARS